MFSKKMNVHFSLIELSAHLLIPRSKIKFVDVEELVILIEIALSEVPAMVK